MSGIKSRRAGGCLGTFLIACIILLGIAIAALAVKDKGKIFKEIINNAEVTALPIPFQEITIEEESLENKYYYSQLEEDQKAVYKEILQGIQDFEEEIYIHTEDGNASNQIFRYILYDMPELFWCNGTAKTTTYKPDGQEEYSIINITYTHDSETVTELKAQIEAEVNQCLTGVPADSTDYEKIKYVYEYIVDTVEYDMSAEDNQNICSVFIGKSSVCAGYARATQHLLESMGIFCTYVPGTASGGNYSSPVDHAWNLVMCDGEYYYVDATWGDPVFAQTEEASAFAEMETINFDYLCCNDDSIFKTHTLAEGIVMPVCTSNEYDYYVMNGMYYTENNSESYLKAMNNAISAKESSVVFKFSDNELYHEAKDQILGELAESSAQYLMTLYNLETVNYYYQEEELLNKLVIYWVYE